MFFFFFKQKTAYEMRISDWSSDVCSSDLAVEAEYGRGGEAPEPFKLPLGNGGAERRDHLAHAGLVERDRIHIALDHDHPPGLTRGEIGRASCRERVCQYV